MNWRVMGKRPDKEIRLVGKWLSTNPDITYVIVWVFYTEGNCFSALVPTAKQSA